MKEKYKIITYYLILKSILAECLGNASQFYLIAFFIFANLSSWIFNFSPEFCKLFSKITFNYLQKYNGRKTIFSSLHWITVSRILNHNNVQIHTSNKKWKWLSQFFFLWIYSSIKIFNFFFYKLWNLNIVTKQFSYTIQFSSDLKSTRFLVHYLNQERHPPRSR